MGKIRNRAEIKSYDNPEETPVTVNSHWNSNKFIVIKIGTETRTVAGNDLKRAIDNCMNVGPY